MAFKIKDLMISVLSAKAGAEARICEGSCPELSCDVGTNCDIDLSQVFCDICSDFGSGCLDCSDGTDCTDCTAFTCDPCSGGCTDCTVCTGCTCTGCTACTACSGCTCTKCTGCTCTHCTAHTCTVHTACTVCSRNTCAASIVQASPRLRASDLPKLKAQLQRALKRVEAREQAVARKLQPQSVEQIELLEAKLREALEELARQKKELPAKEEKGGSEKKNPKK